MADICGDALFGPIVLTTQCRGGFDFTIAFEESILTLLPAVVFIISTTPRIAYLWKERDRSRKGHTYTLKMAGAALLVILQLAVTVLALSSDLMTRFTIATAVLAFVVKCLLVILFHIEHVKTIRPSLTLSLYLFATMLFDAARVRTEWLMGNQIEYALVLTQTIFVKIFLLVVENIEKRADLIRHKENHSVESTSGPISRGLFFWVNPLLALAWKTELSLPSLPPIFEELSSQDLLRRFAAKWDPVSQNQRASLIWATLKVLKWNMLVIVIPRSIAIGLTVLQPFLIASILRFLSSPEVETAVGYGLVGAFGIVYMASAVTNNCYEHLSYRAVGIVRGGFTMLIYRKVLLLNSGDVVDSPAISILGNDVEMLADRVKCLLVDCWANLVTVCLAMWLLAEDLGVICIIPILMAVASLLITDMLSKKSMKRQTEYQKAAESRVNFTTEVVSSVRAVRILGYTERFKELITKKRNIELTVGKAYRWMTVWANGVSHSNVTTTQIVTFGAFAISIKINGIQDFTYIKAIITLSILTVLTGPLTQLMGDIKSAYEAVACFRRIQAFLQLSERVDKRKLQSPGASYYPIDEYYGADYASIRPQSTTYFHAPAPADVSISDGSFGWKGSECAIVRDIDLSTPTHGLGSLTMIIGPVSSGKSTLLRAIMGETDHANGHVKTSTTEIAFCEQVPWIINTTIRDNIVAESYGYDENWYQSVLTACDLLADLAQMEQGDLTVVGDQGFKLSSGQRARIALARAVYSRKRIAVFDEPFSSLDRATEKVVFDRVFSSTGLLRRNGIVVIVATDAIHHLPSADHIVVLNSLGHIMEQGSFENLKQYGDYVKDLRVSERASMPPPEDAQSMRSSMLGSTLISSPIDKIEFERQEMVHNRGVCKYYLATLGKKNTAALLFCATAPAAFTVFRSVWLTWWGDGNKRPSDDLGYWMTIFGLLASLDSCFIVTGIMISLIKMAPKSGKILHERVLNAVMSASMSALASTPGGSLANRFSQDMRYIDLILPVSFVILMFEICSSLASVGLAVAAVNWIAITIPVVLMVLIAVQRFYVRASKQLRLLEIESKTPLFGLFGETMNGLATIRSFGWVNAYMRKAITHLDAAQKPFYLLNAIQRWLSLVLDITIALLVTTMVAVAVSLRDTTDPALLGVALVHMMTLGLNLRELIIQWSTVETSLGAVSRIKSFVERTPSENQAVGTKVPASDWLSRGTLELRDVAVRHNNFSLPVVRHVSITIKHGEKIGICGRSGSGKSSLLQALLGMADITEGQVIADGQDIVQVPRSLVRRKISFLAQEPLLFNNTVRFNADPLIEHSDEDIIASMKRVGLWYFFVEKSADGRDPLSVMMSESMLSQGQRQLFCLGRALMKQTSILVLDEPTSCLDSQTDAMVQQVIRSQFKDRTVIMVAHRLNTLLDFDKIAMLDQGALVEYDTPRNLMRNINGHFAMLYRADKKRDTMGDFISSLFKDKSF